MVVVVVVVVVVAVAAMVAMVVVVAGRSSCSFIIYKCIQNPERPCNTSIYYGESGN